MKFKITLEAEVSQDGEMAVDMKYDGLFNPDYASRAYVFLGHFIYKNTLDVVYGIPIEDAEIKGEEINQKIKEKK